MKKSILIFVGALAWVLQGVAQTAPLVLVKTIDIPSIPEGHRTDHLAFDLQGGRLFATMQEAHEIVVIEPSTARVIYRISLANPHAVVYRSDLDRIYVSDDDPTQPGLRVFSGKDYQPVDSVQLLKRTDSMVYDPNSKYLYIVNGGESAKLDYSEISVIDSSTNKQLGNIKVSAGSLEDMDIDSDGGRLYGAVADKKEVVVADIKNRTVLATWPVTTGSPVATAVDTKHSVLFVATRTSQLHGSIEVLDTKTGKQIKTLPIGGMLDYMVFDPQSERIYAVCGVGDVYVYQERSTDTYDLLGSVETALLARTGLLVPELHQFFVSSPNTGLTPAQILIFRIQ